MELVLRGVGGRTIEEAKRNVTYREFSLWRLYIDKHGLPALGVEATQSAIAMLTWRVDRAAGGTSEISDWMPGKRSGEADIADVAKLMGVKQVKKHG